MSQAPRTPSSVTYLPLPQFVPMLSFGRWVPHDQLIEQEQLELSSWWIGLVWWYKMTMGCFCTTTHLRVSQEDSHGGKSLRWIDSDDVLHHLLCVESIVTRHKDLHGLVGSSRWLSWLVRILEGLRLKYWPKEGWGWSLHEPSWIGTRCETFHFYTRKYAKNKREPTSWRRYLQTRMPKTLGKSCQTFTCHLTILLSCRRR